MNIGSILVLVGSIRPEYLSVIRIPYCVSDDTWQVICLLLIVFLIVINFLFALICFESWFYRHRRCGKMCHPICPQCDDRYGALAGCAAMRTGSCNQEKKLPTLLRKHMKGKKSSTGY